jgi:DNA replication protein DnaC
VGPRRGAAGAAGRGTRRPGRLAPATRRARASFPTSKTFLLEALGQAAVEAGKHVAWFTLEQLGVIVRAHRADDSVTRAITRILRADLVVVDDIGLLPVAPDAAEGLYRLVDAAYEKRSVASAPTCTRRRSTS